MADSHLTPAERWSLGALVIFTMMAALGYGIFALHPARIPDDAFSQAFFGHAYPWFARLHIILSGIVLAVAFIARAGLRWFLALTLVAGLAFLAEHIGTGTGFPFSGYSYTGLLGARIGSRVPWLIPISWFLMAAPSWILARHSFPDRALPRVLFATWLLVLWDLALDPAMSFLTPYWIWETGGAYYGMPLVNLIGWWGTGMVLMVALELLDRRVDWAGTVPARWALWFYLTILLMPLAMLVAYGAWLAVGVTLGALGLAVVLHLWSVRSASPRRSPPFSAESRVTESA